MRSTSGQRAPARSRPPSGRRRRPIAGHPLPGRRRGQALVEFALIVPVFLLLLLVAIDFGRLFFTYIQLNNTAREAAAYAAANPATDNATLTTIAQRETNLQAQRGEGAISATSACVDNLGNTILCADSTGSAGSGDRITVSVGETFTFLTPFVGTFWPGGLHVGTSATAAVFKVSSSGGIPPSECTTPPPTPSFTWQSPDPVNRPNLISVDAGASPNLPVPCQIVGYNWDFGGASTDPGSDYLREGVTQDYEYASGGTYTVKLTVQNAAGEASTTRTITVGTTACQAPTASFTVTPAAIYDGSGNITNWTYYKNGPHPGTAFSFDGSASAFMADPACHPVWSWNLGGTTVPASPPATATVSSFTYHLAGNAAQTVHVKLTVTNDAGTASLTVDLPLVQDK
jgi:Flp pilus assembly protein TadG